MKLIRHTLVYIFFPEGSSLAQPQPMASHGVCRHARNGPARDTHARNLESIIASRDVREHEASIDSAEEPVTPSAALHPSSTSTSSPGSKPFDPNEEQAHEPTNDGRVHVAGEVRDGMESLRLTVGQGETRLTTAANSMAPPPVITDEVETVSRTPYASREDNAGPMIESHTHECSPRPDVPVHHDTTHKEVTPQVGSSTTMSSDSGSTLCHLGARDVTMPTASASLTAQPIATINCITTCGAEAQASRGPHPRGFVKEPQENKGVETLMENRQRPHTDEKFVLPRATQFVEEQEVSHPTAEGDIKNTTPCEGTSSTSDLVPPASGRGMTNSTGCRNPCDVRNGTGIEEPWTSSSKEDRTSKIEVNEGANWQASDVRCIGPHGNTNARGVAGVKPGHMSSGNHQLAVSESGSDTTVVTNAGSDVRSNTPRRRKVFGKGGSQSIMHYCMQEGYGHAKPAYLGCDNKPVVTHEDSRDPRNLKRITPTRVAGPSNLAASLDSVRGEIGIQESFSYAHVGKATEAGGVDRPAQKSSTAKDLREAHARDEGARNRRSLYDKLRAPLEHVAATGPNDITRNQNDSESVPGALNFGKEAAQRTRPKGDGRRYESETLDDIPIWDDVQVNAVIFSTPRPMTGCDVTCVKADLTSLLKRALSMVRKRSAQAESVAHGR